MNFVVVGKVIGTFGTEGDLKVLAIAPEEFFKGAKKLYFKRKGGGFVPFGVERVSEAGGYLIVKLIINGGIEDAKGFVGAKIYAQQEELPSIGEDEYYAFELEGMEVFTQEGEFIGLVERVEEGGPYSYLVLNKGNTWIPFHSEVVLSVDRDKRRITVRDNVIP